MKMILYSTKFTKPNTILEYISYQHGLAITRATLAKVLFEEESFSRIGCGEGLGAREMSEFGEINRYKDIMDFEFGPPLSSPPSPPLSSPSPPNYSGSRSIYK